MSDQQNGRNSAGHVQPHQVFSELAKYRGLLSRPAIAIEVQPERDAIAAKVILYTSPLWNTNNMCLKVVQTTIVDACTQQALTKAETA